MAQRIITISREFGSGGRFIGEEVAKKLGIAYYDKNVINDIAEKSGLSPEYILENAELSPKKGMLAYALAYAVCDGPFRCTDHNECLQLYCRKVSCGE